MAAAFALLSGVLWGSADFAGGVLARRATALAVLTCSQFTGLLAVVGVAVATDAFAGPLGWLPWSLLAGVAGASGLAAFYAALAAGTMGVVAPITGLAVAVPVVGGFLAGETPTTLQGAGMVVAVLGVIATSGPELSAETLRSARARNVGLALVAASLFGVALLGLQRGAATSPVLTTVGMRLTTVMSLLLAALVLRTPAAVPVRWVPAVALVGLADVGANLLYGYASSRGSDSVTAVLGSLYPVVTVLLGALVLNERILLVQRVGVILALGGIALLAAG